MAGDSLAGPAEVERRLTGEVPVAGDSLAGPAEVERFLTGEVPVAGDSLASPAEVERFLTGEVPVAGDSLASPAEVERRLTGEVPVAADAGARPVLCAGSGRYGLGNQRPPSELADDRDAHPRGPGARARAAIDRARGGRERADQRVVRLTPPAAQGGPAAVGAVEADRPSPQRVDGVQGVGGVLLLVLVAVVVASVMLWYVANAFGSIQSIEKSVRTLFDLTKFTSARARSPKYTAIGGGILAVCGTFANVLAACMYNLISDLVGGVRFDVIDESR